MELTSKFHQNSSRITEKWRQNGAQSGPRGSRGSKNHAEITKTRPEALGAGTLAAFWMKNCAQEDPQGYPEGTKMYEKFTKKMVSFSKSVSELRFVMVFHGFVVDFDEKRVEICMFFSKSAPC